MNCHAYGASTSEANVWYSAAWKAELLRQSGDQWGPRDRKNWATIVRHTPTKLLELHKWPTRVSANTRATLDELRTVQGATEVEAQARAQKTVRERLQAWCLKLGQDWELHGTAAYRYVKEVQQQCIVILQLADGRLTGNFVDTLQQFRMEW